MENRFAVNQIVKGRVAGVFVILGFRLIDGVEYAQVKIVNPKDYSQVQPGEFALPLEGLQEVN